MKKEANNHSYEHENPPLTLKNLLEKIIRARWWILKSLIIFLFFTTYISYSTPPIYRTTVSIMIENNRAQKIFDYNPNDNFKISDEIAVIKSRTIAEDVVKALWNSNKRNRLYLFGTKIFMPKGQRLRRPIRKLLSFGKWSPEQNQAPQFHEDYNDEIGRKFYPNVINSLDVYHKRGTNIIQISVSNPHPYEAALIANYVADAYNKRDKEWSSNESANLKSFLEQRLDEKELEIKAVQFKIETYKRDNKIYDIFGDSKNISLNIRTLESELNSNDSEIKLIQDHKLYLNKQLSELEKGLVDQMLSSINAQLFALQSEVNEKEAELVRNSSVYGSDHEAVLKTKANLQTLKKQLENKTNEMISEDLSILDPIQFRQEIMSKLLNIETELHQLDGKSIQYALQINKYQKQYDKIPEKQSYLENLGREKEVLSSTYTFIRQRIEEARVSVASESGKVRIINRAEQPGKPISPDIARNILLAIIIGSLCGFIISSLIEYFDNTVKSIDFIENKQLPILAVIPSIGNSSAIVKTKTFFLKKYKNLPAVVNGRKTIGDLQRRMVTHEDPKSPISEAYRSLRTSLMYTAKHTQGSIMVSSPGPGEGKTTTIINLAITYANLGKKTILIDGDLRKPVIHKLFNGENSKGLTHYLSGTEENLDLIISKTDIENLDVIYNGAIPPNPSELLGSLLMDTLVAKLNDRYDIVLFDAPPILAVTDAIVLARLVDQFILVVRFGITDKSNINFVLSSLDNIQRSLTGVVLNDLNQKNSYYSTNYFNYQEYYQTLDTPS